VSAAFHGPPSGALVVDVAITNVARLSAADWDAARQYLNEHPHSDWITAYGGTSIRDHLQPETMSAATMMAIGALHPLTPASREVVNFEAKPQQIMGIREFVARHP
jgi:hypothetical protein